MHCTIKRKEKGHNGHTPRTGGLLVPGRPDGTGLRWAALDSAAARRPPRLLPLCPAVSGGRRELDRRRPGGWQPPPR